MRVFDTKNQTDRTAALSGAVRAILERVPRRLDGRVFGMTDNEITKTMAAVREVAGNEGLRFHDLQNEAISRLFDRTQRTERQIGSGHTWSGTDPRPSANPRRSIDNLPPPASQRLVNEAAGDEARRRHPGP